MTPLAEAWPAVVDLTRGHADWVIASDFDGTLVPLAERPSAVALGDEARLALTRLATRPGVTVAIASGRRLADLERHISVRHTVLVANHGFEVRLPGGPTWTEETPDDLSTTRAFMAALHASALMRIAGLRVEDKGPVVAIHLRGVERARHPEVAGWARANLGVSGPLSIIEGRDALEIRPRRAIHKGSALCRALRALGVSADALWWYFGDDASDEDVFRTLPSRSITVHVGRHRASSAARFTVDGPSVVPSVLAALDEIAAARASPPAAAQRSISDRPDLL